MPRRLFIAYESEAFAWSPSGPPRIASWWPFEFESTPVIIGRTRTAVSLPPDAPSGAQVCIHDANVARLHMQFVLHQDAVFAVDLQSSGGIELDGRRITRHALQPHDVVRFADHALRAWLGPPSVSAAQVEEAAHPDTPLARLTELVALSMRTACEVAANPNTPLALLEELARCPSLAVPWAVATNPSLPPAMQHDLWRRFPDAALENPLFALHSLADPGLSIFSAQAALWLARRHRTPEAILRALALHPDPATQAHARQRLG